MPLPRIFLLRCKLLYFRVHVIFGENRLKTHISFSQGSMTPSSSSSNCSSSPTKAQERAADVSRDPQASRDGVSHSHKPKTRIWGVDKKLEKKTVKERGCVEMKTESQVNLQ